MVAVGVCDGIGLCRRWEAMVVGGGEFERI